MSTIDEKLLALSAHFLAAKTLKQMKSTLEGILTPSELHAISQRLEITRLLKEGVSQREITKRLGVGIATVTRGSREIKAGKL